MHKRMVCRKHGVLKIGVILQGNNIESNIGALFLGNMP